MCYNEANRPSDGYICKEGANEANKKDFFAKLREIQRKSLTAAPPPLNTNREVIGAQLSRAYQLVQEYEDAVTTLWGVLGIQEPTRTESSQPPAYTMAEMLARLNDRTSETTDRLQHVTNRLSEVLGGNVKILD